MAGFLDVVRAGTRFTAARVRATLSPDETMAVRRFMAGLLACYGSRGRALFKESAGEDGAQRTDGDPARHGKRERRDDPGVAPVAVHTGANIVGRIPDRRSHSNGWGSAGSDYGITGRGDRYEEEERWIYKLFAAILARAVEDARRTLTGHERRCPTVVDTEARDAVLWLFQDSHRPGSVAFYLEALDMDLTVFRRRLREDPIIAERFRRMYVPHDFSPKARRALAK
jgi:hypothetical protein